MTAMGILDPIGSFVAGGHALAPRPATLDG
jgi:hypothetical protein